MSIVLDVPSFLRPPRPHRGASKAPGTHLFLSDVRIPFEHAEFSGRVRLRGMWGGVSQKLEVTEWPADTKTLAPPILVVLSSVLLRFG